MTIRSLSRAAAAALVAAAASAHAVPGFVTAYSEGFQSGSVGAEWSATAGNLGTLAVETVPATTGRYAGQRFLGQFGRNDLVTLTVANPFAASAVPVNVYLAFDAYLIRSWDGNDTRVVNEPLGPDSFGARASWSGGQRQLFEDTFSIGEGTGQTQSYCPFGTAPCAPTWGAQDTYLTNPLGYRYTIADASGNPVDLPKDMVYSFDRPASPGFAFTFSGPSLSIEFYSRNLQTLNGLADESWGLDNVRVEMAPVPEPQSYALLAAGLLAVVLIARRRAVRAA